MKIVFHVTSGRTLPGKAGLVDTTVDKHLWVAWAELDGHAVTGRLASHTNRDVAEHQATLELARRLRELLDAGASGAMSQESIA